MDRAKGGLKRSQLTAGAGIPLAAVSAPANTVDHILLTVTPDAIKDFQPLPARVTVHLDAGYDHRPARQALADRGLFGQIAHRGAPAPLPHLVPGSPWDTSFQLRLVAGWTVRCRPAGAGRCSPASDRAGWPGLRCLVHRPAPEDRTAMTATLPFEDHFDDPVLDTAVWIPHYLPQWSSRAASAAVYDIADSCLRLHLPEGHPLWCPEDHPPLRVSGVQSGVFSGPVGSTVGQQPVRPGAVVREEQPAHWGWTPRYGHLEMRARATLTPRSMAAWWLVGLEDRAERCAELCVMEVFGDTMDATPSAAVGMGTHPFRDARMVEDFAAPRLDLDIGEFHTYAVDWRPDRAVFLVDGEPVRTVGVTPDYPMQTMLAVFDFPEKAVPGEPYVEPELVIDHIRATPDR